MKGVKQCGRNSPWRWEKEARQDSETRSRQMKELTVVQETWQKSQRRWGAVDIFLSWVSWNQVFLRQGYIYDIETIKALI